MRIPLHIQRKYIDGLSFFVEKFSQQSNERWNGRCPFCGDSKKSQSKKRFWVYRKNDTYLWACYNCSEGGGLNGLLKLLNPVAAKEMFIEALKDNGKYIEPVVKKQEQYLGTGHFENLCENSVNCFELDEEHPAVLYLKQRQLYEHAGEFYFTENYGDCARAIPLKNSERLHNDARIIIPAFDGEKNFIGCFARAIEPDNKLRYISAPIDGRELIYGLDKLKYDRDIYVVEGAIDSLAIDNCVAVGCADLARIEKYIPDAKKRCVLIPDGERRNKQILQGVKKYIMDGWRVVLMPEKYIESGLKDLNNFRVHGKMSKIEIINIINKNIVSGLSAQLKFSKYGRVKI